MIDIGLNLADQSFEPDRSAVVERARTAGVVGFVLTGTDVEQSARALELARRDPALFRATAGVHPHRAAGYDERVESELRTLWSDDLVAAVGECGLDYFRDFSPRADQRRAFERQLIGASECRKPVFLHERGAADDFLAILSEHRSDLVDACLHCFTGERPMLEAVLALDVHVGITGWICDERRGLGLRELVPSIPADRLLIETDAPYLIPRTLRPRPKTRRNEPQWLPEVCRVVAECRREDSRTVAARTEANARRLFRWPAAGPDPDEGR